MNEDRIADIFIIGVVITVIILKIVNIITIPWVWLLCPIWGLMGVGVVFAIIIIISYYANSWWKSFKRRKKNET